MKPIITALAAAIALASCTKQETVQNQTVPPPGTAGTDKETVTVMASVRNEKEIDTKSILKDADIEDRITCITLAAYDKGGLLRDRRHFTSGFSSMSLNVLKGNETNYYALANMGDMTEALPAKESDLGTLSYRLSSYSDVASAGIPMCGYVKDSECGNNEIHLELDRLFAKLSVRILHNGLLNSSQGQIFAYNLCNRSVYLRQANTRLFPFSNSGSRALDPDDTMEESDYHADLNNRSEYEGSLNMAQLGPGPGYFKDTTLVFYIPENVQGTLLPGNDDPSAKIPENIASLNGQDYSSLCTFLEFNAKRENTGIGYGGGVTYRYYLGADSTTDFSIERNCKYTLTMDFTEEGFFFESWKMSRNEDWKDTRVLRFVENPYVIYKGDTKNVMVHYHTSTSAATSSMLKPDDWSYTFDEDAMKAAGLSYTIDKNTLVTGNNGYKDFCFEFLASSEAKAGASFPMRITSWDGGINDFTTITIAELGSIAASWDFCPTYVSQEGTLSISGIPADKMPVTVSGYDSDILKITKESDTSFKVMAINPGESSVTISNCDGSQTQKLTLTVQTPRLRLKSSSVSVNPDGTSIKTEYIYIDRTGVELSHVNGQVFASTLKAAMQDNPEWIAGNITSSGIQLYVRKLTDSSGTEIETGKDYYVTIGASGCSSVEPQRLRVHLTNPFAGIRSNFDYGKIDDCTLSECLSVNSRVREYFAQTVQDNRITQLEAPIPNADAAQTGAAIIPMWTGKFSNACEAFGIKWVKSSSFASGASFRITQNNIITTTRHSAGRHGVYVTVTNKHSSESISMQCGTIDIYVHVAIGASAKISCQNGTYNQSTNYGTFASVYNGVLERPFFSDFDQYIYYMDVSTEYLVPVDGVYLFSMMNTGIRARQNIFNCLDIVKPSLNDKETFCSNLLASVYDNMTGDRIVVGNEPFGFRKGIGPMLYRAVLLNRPSSEMQERDLLISFLGHYPSGTNSKEYGPKYNVHDMNLGSDPSANTVSRNKPFHFCPTELTEYVDSKGQGYHIIHFLDTIAPDTNGWVNLL